MNDEQVLLSKRRGRRCFFDRVDCYWLASPRDMMQLLDIEDANGWWDAFFRKNLCCLSRYFGRRLRAQIESKSESSHRGSNSPLHVCVCVI